MEEWDLVAFEIYLLGLVFTLESNDPSLALRRGRLRCTVAAKPTFALPTSDLDLAGKYNK